MDVSSFHHYQALLEGLRYEGPTGTRGGEVGLAVL